MDWKRQCIQVIGLGMACVLLLGAKPVDQSRSGTDKQTASVVPVNASSTDKSSPALAPSINDVSTQPGTSLDQLPNDMTQQTTIQRSPAATYDIPWQSINGGGGPSSSTNYSVNASVGQSAIGFATSTNYQAGIGYWYGSNAATSCDCPYQCDFNEDTFLDALDLNDLIQALFFGGPNPQDPNCPTTRGDFNNDGFPDALDLNELIQHLFFGGTPPVDPCA